MTPEKYARGEIEDLLAKAKAHFDSLTPSEQDEMRQQQRESWVRGELAFGTDRDEALSRAALRQKNERIERAAMPRIEKKIDVLVFLFWSALILTALATALSIAQAILALIGIL